MASRKITQPRMSAEERKWRTQSDMGTLRQAEEIKADGQRMNAVKREAAKQAKELSKLAKK